MLPLFCDVVYATKSKEQTLDIYLPEDSCQKHPVIVYMHGGAFMGGNKRFGAIGAILKAIDDGYAVVSAEYRKSGEARFPAMVHDGKAIVRFLRANAEKFRLDPERIALWGDSSGGWLVTMTALTVGVPGFTDASLGNADEREDVQAVIDWCGPCGNFLDMDRAFLKSGYGKADHNEKNSPESLFLGTAITDVPELCALASPTTYVHKKMPPICIVHGVCDQLVPVEQSLHLAECVRTVAGEENCRLILGEGKLHVGDAWFESEAVMNACFDWIKNALDRVK